MKKICYIITFILTLFVCNNAYAVYQEEESAESKLLAICEYNAKGQFGDGPYKLRLEIDKENKVRLVYFDLYDGNLPMTEETIDNKMVYTDFVDKNNKLTCDIPIYVKKVVGAINNRQARVTHTIQTSKIEDNTVYRFEFNVDKEKSKVFHDNIDKEEINQGKWDKICHYGSFYLKINRNEYETNISGLRESASAYADALDVMKFLIDNEYSCPTSLCSDTFQYGEAKTTYYAFKMEYDPQCIVSQDYVSKYKCGSLDYHMQDVDKFSKSTDASDRIKLNKRLEIIKTFCNSVFQHSGYSEPTNCVKECLQIQDYIMKELKFDTEAKCGLSGKLITYIANIVKWLKYIIPVIVIILGILDFIKAIAAGKDDEMKKAQGRFIKRLIAAALIFIIPFIIEFILNVMGFDANGCGIIDL